MAFITQRGKVWYLGRRVNGKTVRTSLDTTDRKRAKILQQEFEARQRAGQGEMTRTSPGLVVKAYLDHCQVHLSSSRCDSIRLVLKELLEGEHHIHIQQFEKIQSHHITQWFNQMTLANKWQASTAMTYRGILSGFWTWAIKHYGFHGPNPVANCPTYRIEQKPIRFLTGEQVEQQLRLLESEPQLKAMVAVWIYAGLRLSEVLHLTWDDMTLTDVSLTNRWTPPPYQPAKVTMESLSSSTEFCQEAVLEPPRNLGPPSEPCATPSIELTSAYNDPCGNAVSVLQPTYALIRIRSKSWPGGSWKPKTGRDRVVPVSRRLRFVLANYQPQCESRWMFPAPCGGLWTKGNFTRHFRAVQGRLGLKWTCLDYRHTFGSHLAQGNVSPFKIAKLMGNSEGVVRKHYAALISEDMGDEVELAGG